LMPMTEAEMNESPRGKKAEISENVMNVFSRIDSQYGYKLYEERLDEKIIGLDFLHSKFGEGYKVIFSNSSFKMHEWGFITLCEIAELSIDKPDVGSTLFRTRYGYNPAHSYFCSSLFEPFFIDA